MQPEFSFNFQQTNIMLKPTDKNRRVSSFFMWLFSRALGLWRTLVRRREPNHAFCIELRQPFLLND